MRTAFPKRLVYSIAIVLAWLGFVVEGSHALFTDSATLSGNILTTGSIDLMISNSQNPTSSLFADTRPGFIFNADPGQTTEKYFFLKNVSQSDLPLDILVNSGSPDLMTPLGKSVNLEFTPVDSEGKSMGSAVPLSLDSLPQGNKALKVTIPKGDTQRFLMKTTLSAGFSDQGKSITYDLNFVGSQHYVP